MKVKLQSGNHDNCTKDCCDTLPVMHVSTNGTYSLKNIVGRNCAGPREKPQQHELDLNSLETALVGVLTSFAERLHVFGKPMQPMSQNMAHNMVESTVK